jgi:hypothetical protein
MNTYPYALKSPCPADAPIYAALLPRLRAGLLSQPEQEALRKHLTRCAPCREQAANVADQVVEDAVRHHYSAPDAEPPFLTLDAIRRRASLGRTDEVVTTSREPRPIYDGDNIVANNDTRDIPDTQPDTQPDASSSYATERTPFRPPTRWRTAMAVVATVALISLFALLLHSFAASNNPAGPAGPHNGGSNPATNNDTSNPATNNNNTQPPKGAWHTVDSMTYSSTVFTQTPYPVFSPKNPDIVYETSLSPMSARRSDDGGKTWRQLDLPTSVEQAIELEIFASPLDARTVFLTVTVNLAYGQGPESCPTASVASVGAHGNMLASGQMPCSTTYRSANEGATWKAISFPMNGTISTPYSESAPFAGTLLQAQGTRLYAMLTCGPTCGGGSGRLVKSSNGGATWQVADAGGLGSGVCDYAAQPDSAIIFAAVSRGSCEGLNAPTLAIDRSDDAGENWVHVSFLPQGASQGMASVIVGGKALLVVNLPAVSWQPHIISVGQSASEFLVSADGGRTFKAAPLAGVPAKAQPIIAPLIVEGDGSLVVAFTTNDGQAAKVYVWKLGQASWRMFAPAPNGQLATLLRAGANGADETFWAVIQDNGVQQDNTMLYTFTVASYQP